MRKSLPLFLLFVTLLMSLSTGCTSVTTATPLPPDQAVARNVATIRLASSLATKAALVAVEDKEATSIAKTANTVAGVVYATMGQDDFNLTAARVFTAKTIAAQTKLTPKQKVIATQLADTLALLVQSQIDTQSSSLTSDQQLTVTRKYIGAACNGVSDATALWVDTPDTPDTHAPAATQAGG